MNPTNAKSIPKPQSLGIFVCDSVIDDRVTGKKTLVGIFNTINAVRLPCKHPELHVFIALTEGYNSYKVRLVCTHRMSGTKNFELEGAINFQDPNAVVELNFGLKGLTFSAYGLYDFDFYCDDDLIASRKFIVSELKQIVP